MLRYVTLPYAHMYTLHELTRHFDAGRAAD